MTVAGLRPRTAPELIDAAIAILRRHYFELLSTAVVCTVGAMAIIAAALIAATLRTPVLGSSAVTIPALALAFVGFFAMAQATSVVIATSAYLGEPVDIGIALRRAISRFWPAMALTVLRFTLIVLGFVCFIVPGIYCALWFFASMNALIVENVGPIEALRRSHQLAKGSLGRVFGVLLLFAVITFIVRVTVVDLLIALVPPLHAGTSAALAISNGIGFLLYPFLILAATVLYFDLRIRKEGLDVELMAKEIDAVGSVAT